MSRPHIVWIDECDSTNSRAAAAVAENGLCVATHRQTAGRGQRGNSWEAEPGKNLTFSTVTVPDTPFAANRQFELSMAVALAVADTVNELLAEAGLNQRAKVKWPNDIYVDDRKIAGILIENSLSGKYLQRSIAGIGLNVNQSIFRSDAPNPTSITLLTGRTYDLNRVLRQLADTLFTATQAVIDGSTDTGTLLARYKAQLWRGEGEHLFREPQGAEFRASIADIDPQGPLKLSNGRSYAFKEIIFVL